MHLIEKLIAAQYRSLLQDLDWLSQGAEALEGRGDQKVLVEAYGLQFIVTRKLTGSIEMTLVGFQYSYLTSMCFDATEEVTHRATCTPVKLVSSPHTTTDTIFS